MAVEGAWKYLCGILGEEDEGERLYCICSVKCMLPNGEDCLHDAVFTDQNAMNIYWKAQCRLESHSY
jgi:hypothetical protein